MQQVILGLLILHGPLSLYAVQRLFEQGVSLFYSASSGSIQRALRQLAEQGLATTSDASTGARSSKPYTVTDAGRQAWRDWMLAPLAGSDAETTMLAKVFFLGLIADPGERAGVIDTIRTRIAADLAELESVAAGLDGADVPSEYADVFAFQRATLDYGIRSHRLAREWAHELGA